jgi:hypothetical protein
VREITKFSTSSQEMFAAINLWFWGKRSKKTQNLHKKKIIPTVYYTGNFFKTPTGAKFERLFNFA